MASKHSNVIIISPDYKFKRAVHRKSQQNKSKINFRKTSLGMYRAYDKQRLLEQIDNKLNQKNNAVAQNRQLKAQIQKIMQSGTIQKMTGTKNSNQISNIGTNKSISKNGALSNSLSNTRIYSTLVCLKQQNEQLRKEIGKKNEEVVKIKKSGEYCQFQEILYECLAFQEQFSRLKNILKERKKKKMEIKRQRIKARNEKINEILNQQRGIEYLAGHSAQMKQNLRFIVQEVARLRNKNKEIMKTKRRILEDIDNLRGNSPKNISTPVSKLQKLDYGQIETRKCSKNQSHQRIVEQQYQQSGIIIVNREAKFQKCGSEQAQKSWQDEESIETQRSEDEVKSEPHCRSREEVNDQQSF